MVKTRVKIFLCPGDRFDQDQIQEKELAADEAMKILEEKAQTLREGIENPQVLAFDASKYHQLSRTLTELTKQIDELSPQLDDVGARLGIEAEYRQQKENEAARKKWREANGYV